MRQIDPERMAEMLHKARRGEDGTSGLCDLLDTQPRIAEALVFIQWWDMQPGGANEKIKNFLDKHGEAIGTRAMRDAGAGPWSMEQARVIWDDMRQREGFYNRDFKEWAADKDFRPDPGPSEMADMREGLARYNRDFFIEDLRSTANVSLASFFVDLCEGVKFTAARPWYFVDVFPALFAYMDEHARATAAGLADTAAKEKILRRLDFAVSTGTPVTIFGDSAAGKTACGRNAAVARPGLWRFVTPPSDGRERRFYEVHADAVGIDYTPTMPLHILKSKVEFVIRNFGVGIIYDEAQYLIPTNYKATTPPTLMNWIRGELIDRGIVAAFFCTRQDFQRKLKAYVKATQYQFAQWIRRIAPPLIIEGRLEGAELAAVAQKLFPNVDPDAVALVADECDDRGTGLQEIEPLMRYVLFVAKGCGRAGAPSLEDVDRAISEYFGEDAAKPSQKRRQASAKPPRTDSEPKISDATADDETETEASRFVTA